MDLDEIFNFHQKISNFEVAQKILIELINKADILVINPEIGTIEILENPQPFQYRFIIEGNHKLIYRVSEIEQLVFVARVVDTRRNPKMKEPLE